MATSPGSYKNKVITPGTDAEVASQIATIDKQAMGVEEMKEPPTKPTIPTPRPNTAVSGLLGEIESISDSYTKGIAERAKTRGQAYESSYDEMFDFLEKSKGESQLKDEAYKSAGVDDADEELGQVNDQISAERHALRRRLEKADLNEQGLFGGALADYKDDIERESLAKQADLAIVQMASQGKSDRARSIADRAVDAQMEKDRQKLDLLKLSYEENKDLFTKEESRLFEEQQAERERTFEFDMYKKKADYEALIDRNTYAYKESVSGGGDGTGGFKLTQGQTAKLLESGFTAQEAKTIAAHIAEFGIEETIKGLSSEQQEAIRTTFAGSQEAVEDNAEQFLTSNYLEGLFGEDELKASAKTAGYRHILSSWSSEKENYLGYLMGIVEQYRTAGYTDKEILEMMQ